MPPKSTHRRKGSQKKQKTRRGKKAIAASSNPKRNQSQGLASISGMVMQKFELPAFCKEVVQLLKCCPGASSSGRPLLFATACSGSGAPSLVLKELVSDPVETMACESNVAAAHALLVNAKPSHCQTDVILQSKRSSVFCYVCNKTCPTLRLSSQVDLLIAGFPCNKNSLMNAQRFEQDATDTPDAQVFQAVADVIRLCRPKVFVLENVDGVNKKRGGSSEDQGSTILTWILEQLKERSGSEYAIAHISLNSIVLLFGLSFSNMCL